MSYSICYAMQAFRYTFPMLNSDAKAWFEQQGGEVTQHFNSDFEQRTGIRLPYQEDVFVLIAEFGESNLFDDEGKRVRGDWCSHGFLRHFDAVRYLGIRWSEDVESGALKPGGRWGSAEGWIKRIKQQLKHAELVSKLPYYCEKSFYSTPLDTLSEKQRALMLSLESIGVKKTVGLYGDEQAFRLSLRPKSVFEWWLFSVAAHQLPSKPACIPMVSVGW